MSELRYGYLFQGYRRPKIDRPFTYNGDVFYSVLDFNCGDGVIHVGTQDPDLRVGIFSDVEKVYARNLTAVIKRQGQEDVLMPEFKETKIEAAVFSRQFESESEGQNYCRLNFVQPLSITKVVLKPKGKQCEDKS